jgi:membrane protease YdiL (CAAX protease family)
MGRTIKLLLLYLLYQVLFTFLVMLVGMLIDFGKHAAKGMETDMTSAELLSKFGTGNVVGTTTIALGVLLAAIAMLWTLYKRRYVYSDASFHRKKGATAILLVCIPFVYTTMYMLNLFCEQLNLPNFMENQFMDLSGNVWGILSIALAAPILEECLFRGAIEGHLLRTWKRPWLAIVVSALVFGVIHMNPVQVVYGFLAGLVFGWLYYRTGSVLPGIVGHILNNALAVVSMRVCDKDTDSLEALLGDAAQPYFLIAYAVIFILSAWYLHKKTYRCCNFSEGGIV